MKFISGLYGIRVFYYLISIRISSRTNIVYTEFYLSSGNQGPFFVHPNIFTRLFTNT